MTDMRQMVFDWFGGAGPAADTVSESPKPPELAKPAGEYVPAEPIASLLSRAHFTHPRANREIVFEKARVAYEFRRGKRRTIGLTIGTEGLVVSAPRWTPLAEVETMLREKERWIIAKLGDARERHDRMESARIEWRDGASIPFLGEQVILVLDPRQRHGRGGAVLETGAESLPGVPRLTLHVGLPNSATPEQLRDTTQAWLMRQARRIFTARLDHFAPQLGVQWQKLSLSSAGTRWGSASADGSIRLNWRLVHFSESIIDYVVVHELAHLREMNHGPRFWAHVESVMPDYAERRGELKDEAVPTW
ncbi:M48 family metallopeptidase [Ottowia sp. VDI28]|uniref:M48 family metallopeptidase n=1 Tax=Ottowia sp. VDI28 TaxID=3133968 RepID=UPI003C303720